MAAGLHPPPIPFGMAVQQTEAVQETSNMLLISNRPSPLIREYCRGATQLDPQVASRNDLAAEAAF